MFNYHILHIYCKAQTPFFFWKGGRGAKPVSDLNVDDASNVLKLLLVEAILFQPRNVLVGVLKDVQRDVHVVVDSEIDAFLFRRRVEHDGDEWLGRVRFDFEEARVDIGDQAWCFLCHCRRVRLLRLCMSRLQEGRIKGVFALFISKSCRRRWLEQDRAGALECPAQRYCDATGEGR